MSNHESFKEHPLTIWSAHIRNLGSLSVLEKIKGFRGQEVLEALEQKSYQFSELKLILSMHLEILARHLRFFKCEDFITRKNKKWILKERGRLLLTWVRENDHFTGWKHRQLRQKFWNIHEVFRAKKRLNVIIEHHHNGPCAEIVRAILPEFFSHLTPLLIEAHYIYDLKNAFEVTHDDIKEEIVGYEGDLMPLRLVMAEVEMALQPRHPTQCGLELTFWNNNSLRELMRTPDFIGMLLPPII